MTAMRLELVGFVGDSAEIGAIDVLGGEEADEGFFTYSGDGHTRAVWAGRAGRGLVLHGRVPRQGRLRGEVAREPVRAHEALPVFAEITVEPRRGDALVRRFPLEGNASDTVWV